MSEKLISIFTNETQHSMDVKQVLTKKLINLGYTVLNEFSKDAELVICVGGDGAFLETIHKCDFPNTPIVGINTGHLGFFQEVLPEDFDKFIREYESGKYTLQKLSTVECIVSTADGQKNVHTGLNEITITGRKSYSIHFDISIDGKPIENFSGDGILVATSAGSTAYNYSVGGSIVDPRLDLLQVTPIAPMNTTAYRSFTSSILLPSELTLGIVPESSENCIYITNDGIETGYCNVKEIEVRTSKRHVNLIRFNDYDFWNKVKDKFL
ncbi:MAG: NAD(+)/NADH kinase [Eubacteriales bacterium]|nr:NAD(+)/NADH kinase [Eubacteriales bacterium]